MPTYEYECSECKHLFEARAKIADRAVATQNPCPSCHKTGTVNLCIGASNLVSPLSIEGLIRPPTPFREKMQKIKKDLPPRYRKNIKDY